MTFATGPQWPRKNPTPEEKLHAPQVVYYSYAPHTGIREIICEDEHIIIFLASANPDVIFFTNDMHIPEDREPFIINKIA